MDRYPLSWRAGGRRTGVHRRLALALALLFSSIVIPVARSTSPVQAAEDPSVVPLVPARVLDTRVGEETVDGLFAGGGVIDGGTELELTVAGRGGVAADAAAVFVNVVATGAVEAGFFTLYPCGESRPLAANLNFGPGVTVGNAALVQVGAGGAICVFSRSTTHAVLDVNGYVPTGDSVVPLVPARVLDTRVGEETVDGLFAGGGVIDGGTELELTVAGRGGVAADAAAVFVNVVATGAVEAGFFTLYPCGESRPLAANLNFGPGVTVGNAALVQVGAGGAICVFSRSTTHAVLDVNGYVPTGDSVVPLVPARVLDTRVGEETVDGLFAGRGVIDGGTELELQIAGRGGVPATAQAAFVNVVATGALEAGFVTLSPCDETRPLAANLNYRAGVNTGSAAFVKLDGDGRICVFVRSTTDVVLDVNGYVAPTVGSQPPVPIIESHDDGELVDIGALGQLPVLSGTFSDPRGVVEEVVVSADGESTSAKLRRNDDGTVTWSTPFAAPRAGEVTFTATAFSAGNETASGEVTLDLVPPGPDVVVVSPFVIVLDDVPGASIDEFDPDTGRVVVTPGDAEIDVGTALVAAPTAVASAGLFSIVESVDEDGSRLVLATRDALLTEVIYQVGEQVAPQQRERSPGDLVSAFGVTTGPHRWDIPVASIPISASIDIGRNDQDDDGGEDDDDNDEPGFGREGSAGVSFEGQVAASLVGSIEIEARFTGIFLTPDVTVKEFGAFVDSSVTGRTTVSVTGAMQARGNKEILDKTIVSGTVPLGWLPLPWDFDFEIDAIAEVEASVEGSLVATFNAPFRAGVELTNGRVEPVATGTVTGGAQAPTLAAEGGVGARIGLEPQFELEIGKSIEVGPGAFVGARASATLSSENRAVCWSIEAGVGPFVQAELKIPLIDKLLFELRLDLQALFVEIAGSEDAECQDEDADGDGVPDAVDNCPDTRNTAGFDRDGDRVGDACDADPDDPSNDSIVTGRSGGSYGHPSLVTLDGLRYLFHGAGDYTLLESVDDGFELQARFGRAFGMTNVSFNRGLAATVGPSVLAFSDAPAAVFDEVPVTLDGELLDIPADGSVVALPDGATIRRVTRCGIGCDAYQVDWPTGEMIQVGVSVGDDFIVSVPPERFGLLRGLLGDGDGQRDNDGVAADGTVANLQDRDELYDVFGASWLLDPDDSLFRTEPDPLEILPIFPTDQITLADLPADAVAAAEAECLAAGVLPGAGLEQCAFDVAITGFSQWIASALAMAGIVEASTPAPSARPVVESSSTLTLGQVVSDSLDAPLVVDEYTFDAEAGDVIDFGFISPCSSTTLAIDVYSPTGARVLTVQSSGCSIGTTPPLPVGGSYVARVYDVAGYSPSYTFGTDGALTLLPNPNRAPTDSGALLEVEISDPANGADVTAPLTVRGLAGVGETIDDAYVVYVVDVSGSTNTGSNDCNGDGVVDEGDDFNSAVNTRNGTILDCELAGVFALNESLAGTSTDVSIVFLGTSSAAADVSPADGIQTVTTPDADVNGNGVPDIEEVLRRTSSGGSGTFSRVSVGTGTNFVRALAATADLMEAREPGRPGYVFFLSDGESGISGIQAQIDRLTASGVRVDTYSVGSGAAGCDEGSGLRSIADGLAGRCTEVIDTSTLSAALTGNPENLAGVSVAVDGGAAVAAAVNVLGQWSVELPELSPGRHVIRATAEAVDGTEVSAEIAVNQPNP